LQCLFPSNYLQLNRSAPAHAASGEDQSAGDVVLFVTVVVADLVCATSCSGSADDSWVASGSTSVTDASACSNGHAVDSPGAGLQVTRGGGPHDVAVAESHSVSSAAVSSRNTSWVPVALSSVVSEDGLSVSVAGAWAARAAADSTGGHVGLAVAVTVGDRVHAAGTSGNSASVVAAVSSPVGLHGKSGGAPSATHDASSSAGGPQVPWVDAVLAVAIGVSHGVAASADNTGNPTGVPPATSTPVAHHGGSTSV